MNLCCYPLPLVLRSPFSVLRYHRVWRCAMPACSSRRGLPRASLRPRSPFSALRSPFSVLRSPPYIRLKNIAIANALALCDETKPYKPPLPVWNIRTPSSSWQGRRRCTPSLMALVLIWSASRKQRPMPARTHSQPLRSLRKVMKMYAVSMTISQLHPWLKTPHCPVKPVAVVTVDPPEYGLVKSYYLRHSTFGISSP